MLPVQPWIQKTIFDQVQFYITLYKGDFDYLNSIQTVLVNCAASE